MAPTPELQRIAAAYPPEARFTPSWEREAYLTEAQQLAWLMRFDPVAAAEVLSAKDASRDKVIHAITTGTTSYPHHEAHYG